MAAATIHRPARDAGVGGNAPAAQGSQDKRRSLWVLLRSREMTHQDLKPENLRISNEVGRAILREGVSGRVLIRLAELFELGQTKYGLGAVGRKCLVLAGVAPHRRAIHADHRREPGQPELEAVVLDVFAQPAGCPRLA